MILRKLNKLKDSVIINYVVMVTISSSSSSYTRKGIFR